MSEESNNQPPGSSTRRKHERREALIQALGLTLDPFGEPTQDFECQITDISQGGVGLLSRRMFNIGDTIYLNIPKLDGRAVYGVMVRNTRYRTGHGYVSGCVWLPKDAKLPPLSAFKSDPPARKSA